MLRKFRIFYSPEQGAGSASDGDKEAKGEKETKESKEKKDKNVDPNAAFLEELNNLARMITNPPTPKQEEKEDGKKGEKGDKDPVKGVNVEIPDGDDFQSFISDPNNFKKVISNVIQQAKEEAKKEILQVVPGEMKKVVREEISFDRAAQDFWMENPDLIPAKPFLAARASIIAAQNPSLSYQEVFKQAGKEVRASLARLGVKGETEGAKFKTGTRNSTSSESKEEVDENDVKAIALQRLKLS